MAGKPLSRRTLLAAAFATACSRSLAPRYFGWLFIASAAEKGLAVADLSDFRKVTTISLGQTPSQVLRVGKKIFATCPDARLLFAVDPDSFRIESRMPFPGRIVSAAVCPNESRIAVITDQPAALHLVDPATRRIVRRIPLPAAPSGLDVSDNIAAVASASAHSIIRIALAAGAIAGVTDLAARPRRGRRQRDREYQPRFRRSPGPTSDGLHAGPLLPQPRRRPDVRHRNQRRRDRHRQPLSE
jgi:hypothetical protein